MRCTTTGARPSDSSSMSRISGSCISTRASASICCWPPDRLRAGCLRPFRELGEELEHVGDALVDLGARCRRGAGPLTARFCMTVRLGNTPLPPGSCTMPCFTRCSGATKVMLRPLRRTHAALGHLEPADAAQDRRLARAVRAEQRDALALVDLEVDVEEHLHRAVGEVGVDHLQHRRARAFGGALALLLLFLEQLLDDEREVVADEARAVHQQQAADDARRHQRG